MKLTTRNKQTYCQRGSAAVVLLLVMVLVLLIIVTMVLGGAGHGELAVRKLEGVRAFYAAEAGLNMAIRELAVGSDEDGDGDVGSISLKTSLPWVQFSVTAEIDDQEITIQSHAGAGQAARVAQIAAEYAGSIGITMIAYGKDGDNRPATRIWDSTAGAWGDEIMANSIGSAAQWLVLRGAPNAEQFALATLDSSHDIKVQVWDGETWDAVLQATSNAGTQATRAFDMAYEQVSGRILLVYRNQNSNQVRYRIYDDEIGWSAEYSHSGLSNAALLWIRLVPIPGTDDIIIMGSHSSPGNHTRVGIWDGTAINDVTSLGAGLPVATTEYLDVAIPESGLPMSVQTGNNRAQYRTLSGTNWSNASNLPNIGSKPIWNRVVAQPLGNEIVVASLSENNTITANVWNGAAWGSNTQITTTAGSTDRRGFDIAYEQGLGGRPLLVYDADSSAVKYRVWDPVQSVWSEEEDGPDESTGPIWNVQAETGAMSGHVFVTWATEDPFVYTAVWNGATFGYPLALGASSAPKERQPFMVSYANREGNTDTDIKVLVWGEIAPQGAE